MQLLKRGLAVLLILSMLLPCIPAYAAGEGVFYLTAATAEEMLIEPVAISYAPGQTLRQAMLASNFAFTGLDSGFITAIEGKAGNFSIFYDNNAFDLDVPAEGVTALCISETAFYSPQLLALICAMGEYNGMTDHVQAYAPAQDAYAEALSCLHTANADQAATLQAQLEQAIGAYHALFSGEKYVVAFDGDFDTVTLTDCYGNQTHGEPVIPGSYQFCVSKGQNRTEGTIEVSGEMRVPVTLPAGSWFGAISLRSASGAGDYDFPQQDDVYFIPDYLAKAYLCAQRGADQPDETVGLYSCYIGTDGTDYGSSRKAWASFNTGLTRAIAEGMEGAEIRLEARYLGADGFTQIQSRPISIVRVPTLAKLELMCEGTRLYLPFDPAVKDYDITAVSDDLSVNAEPFSSESAVKVEKSADSITITISHDNGQQTIYRVKVQKVNPVSVTLRLPANTTAEIRNAADSLIQPYSGTAYHLIPGEQYTCTATENQWFHTQVTFTAANGKTITVAEPDAVSHLAAFGAYSGRDVNKSAAYPADQPFAANSHQYALTIPDANSTLYVQGTPEAGYALTADYRTQTLLPATNGTPKSVAVNVPVDAAKAAVALGQCVTVGGYSNRLTLRLSKTAGEVLYYQDYTFLLRRQATLTGLHLTHDGAELPLTDFDRDVTEYTLKIINSARELTLNWAFRSLLDETKPNTGGYYAEINGEKQENADSATIPLDPALPTEIVTVTACHGDENALPTIYRLTLCKTEPTPISFRNIPGDCNVFVVSELTGKRVTAQPDGSFHLIPGESYTFHITREGCRGIRETGFIAPDHADTLTYTLDRAEENPNLRDLTAQWPSFRADENNNGVISAPTPIQADEAVLYWATQLGGGYDADACGCPIIVDNCLYTYGGDHIFKVDKTTGQTLAVGKMDHKSSFAINSPTYAEGMIFVGLANGCVQAFDAVSLDSLWIYRDLLGGQPNCPIVYHDGRIYTGFWNKETADANFVCLTVTDEDPVDSMEEKVACWYHTQPGGFYWAGAYACDDFLLVPTDDGMAGCTTGFASLLSLDPKSGAVIDCLTMPTPGDIRCSVTFLPETSMAYFTTKGGSFYSVHLEPNGTFTAGSLRGVKLTHPGDSSPNPAMSTCTPTIYNGRAYIGVSGGSQFGAYSGHNITVIDLATNTIAYTVPTQGYPQTSGILTTAYDEGDGRVYVYFFDNYTPGKLRILQDQPGQRRPVLTTPEEGRNTAYVLFTPAEAQAQYAICSPVVDADGTIYFKNDSGYLMAVGSTVEHLEVTEAPQKTTYHLGETFDPTGMAVTAFFANGTARDVTDYVTFATAPLTEDDDQLRLEYPLVMYQDADGMPGTAYHAPIGVVDLNIRTHIFDDPETCEEGHRGTCSYCGEAVTEWEAHEFAWVTDQAPTETQEGRQHEECFCGYRRSENTPIPKLEHTHSYVQTITPATFHEPGLIRSECACGDVQEEIIPPLGCPTADFPDVKPTAWFHPAADWAVASGYIGGIDGRFAATTKANRAMLVTILFRMAGQPDTEYNNPFEDVKENQYFYKAVLWAAKNGIVTGKTDIAFKPKDLLTREQAAAILFRYAQSMGIDTTCEADLTIFPDGNKVSNYAKEPMIWAVANGLINGNKIDGVDLLDAKGTANRGQIAIILMHFADLIA